MSWNLSRRIHYLNMKICFHYSWPPILEKAKWLLVIYFSHNCVQSIISNFGRKTLYSISSSTIKIKGRKIIFCQQTLLVKLQSLKFVCYVKQFKLIKNWKYFGCSILVYITRPSELLLIQISVLKINVLFRISKTFFRLLSRMPMSTVSSLLDISLMTQTKETLETKN